MEEMFCINDENLYAQGIYEFDFYDLVTNDLIFQSKTITEGNISTSVDLNEIRGGIGNAIQIQIPSNSTLTVAMTAANFSLSGLALNTGSTIMPNGTYQVTETVVLEAGATEGTVVGKVTSTPVVPLGATTNEIVGYIDCKEKVIIDPATKEFTVTGGEVGDNVCITYSTQSQSAELFTIGSNFSPKIGRAILRTPLYTNSGTDGNGGILAGELQIVIPKAQLNGDLSLDLSQTSNATTVLNMTALATYETTNGACPSKEGTLGYIVKVINKTSIWDRIANLVVIGGGLALAVGEKETVVVKGVNKANSNLLENVPYEDLTFTIAETATATVDTKGEVTGVAAGDTELTVAYAAKSLSTRADVEVTA